MSARSLTSRPVIVPSLVTDIVRSWIWSRPWWAVSRDSERVSVHFTGLPSFWATSRVTTSSGATAILPPKPPPTSGAMTRSLCSGRPRVSASIVLRMCGTWVEDHMTSCSPVGSTTVERGSMNTGTRRCWRKRRRTTIWSSSDSALLMASVALPPEPASPESNTHWAFEFVPRSGCTRVAPSFSASSMSRTGSSSS